MQIVIAKTSKFIKDVAVITSAMGFAFGLLGTVTYPWTEPYLTIPEKIEDIGQRLGQVESAVDELRPPLRVAIFDEEGSSIFKACKREEPCEGQYRLRRTPEGISCSRPDIVGAFVINHAGRRWGVQNFSVNPVRADGDWVTVPFEFHPPKGAIDGTSRFFFSLEYVNCDFAATGTHVETTLKIPFIITKS